MGTSYLSINLKMTKMYFDFKAIYIKIDNVL